MTIEFDDTTRAWNDWKHGNITNQKSFVHEQYTISLGEYTKLYKTSSENSEQILSSKNVDVPPLVKTPPGINISCHICHKYQGQLYPCRTCGKVYHQQCIKDIGHIQSYYLIKNSTNIIGWSCSICEDLRVLLSFEELSETNTWIQSIDSQTNFSLENYINTRIKSKSSLNFHSNEFYDRIKMILQIYLHTIADVTFNRLSKTDLFNLDVNMKILRTPPTHLVNSLTSFELYRLSQIFLSLSSSDNQYITYYKFHEIFNNYFHTIMPEIDSNETKIHLEALAYNLLSDTVKCDQTWKQFVLNATIPTLLGRYNHRISYDFIHEIFSIKQSTYPKTVHHEELVDNQPLPILNHNILQKFKHTIGNETDQVNDNITFRKMKKPMNKKKINRKNILDDL